jgi:hypothetical protein
MKKKKSFGSRCMAISGIGCYTTNATLKQSRSKAVATQLPPSALEHSVYTEQIGLLKYTNEAIIMHSP